MYNISMSSVQYLSFSVGSHICTDLYGLHHNGAYLELSGALKRLKQQCQVY
jgi:hypothetical protein